MGDSIPLSPYQKRLFAFLSVATFFEGYDFIALTQILPELRRAMALTPSEGGMIVGAINLGAVIAFALVRYADSWGRKRLLTLTIAGYTVFTFATGLAANVWMFVAFQLAARIFLIAEWSTSTVYAAEEFPADRRGMVIGVLQGFSSLGSIACAGVAPLLLRTAYGWRSVYFVGIIPLLILAYARRNLRESKRFAEQLRSARGLASRAAGGGETVGNPPPPPPARRSLLHIWSTPYRNRMLQLALIWGLTYVCTQNAVTFWKEFVVAERGFTEDDVGLAISIAAVASMPLTFFAGKLLDLIGRKLGAAVIFGLGVGGIFAAYGLHGRWPLTLALVFGIFGASAVLPALNTFTTELFPTELRGDAFAWANNLLGRIGYVTAPVAVGIAADALGSWGRAVQLTTVFPLLGLVLIFRWLPETSRKELEETSVVDPGAS